VWERRTAAEIRKVDFRSRFSPIYALIFALLSAALFTFGRTQGYGGHFVQPFPPEPLSRSLQVFPFFFLCMFAVFYLMQVLSRIPQSPDHRAMICNQCKQIVGFTAERHCPCGGQYELLTHWKWIEDEPTKFDPIV
jgi:hypothetical protein